MWPSGQRVKPAIQRSRVRVPPWQQAGFVLGRPEFKSSPSTINKPLHFFTFFPVFNVVEICRVYLLTIDLGIIKFIKNFIERFFEKCEIYRCGPTYVQKL